MKEHPDPLGEPGHGLRRSHVLAITLAIAIAVALAVPSIARAEAPGPINEPGGPWREQLHWAPTQDESGRTRLLFTRICRPKTDAPSRLVVINHGKPRSADVGKVTPASCTNEAVQWFVQRGYVVVAGVRRGYGKSEGNLAEDSGACGAADLLRGAREGARDVDAILNYAVKLPFVLPDHVVVVGQSVGGWVTDAYAGMPHPRVAAMVSMAGGNGGHIHDIPNNNCRPDQLALAAGTLGKAATIPMMWIYTANDSYFGPPLAKAMYDQFTASGGTVEFHALPAFAQDGHTLFFGPGGAAIWGPLMQDYLARRAP